MASIITIILFFVYCYGLGLGLSRFTKESEDFLERFVMRIGIGLAIIPALGLLLNVLKIPIDWKIFLGLSIISILSYSYNKFRKTNKFEFNINKVNINLSSLLMLILFFITFYMYGTGAFSYPYLEDDDPWSHAMGVSYVSIEKTVFAEGTNNVFHYLDPYPPSYDLFMGVIYQTNNSMYWTLKFFNALIISLSIPFFYYFVKSLTKSSKKALFSAFILFAIPSFVSHFIWAISLAMPLYFVAFYCLEKIKDNKKWVIPSIFVIGATLTVTPTHSTYFGLLLGIYLVAKTIINKKLVLYEYIAGFGGLLYSFLFWWMPMMIKYGVPRLLSRLGISGLEEELGRGTTILSVGGSGDRIYTMSDFVVARLSNLINNPIGVGIVISLIFAGALFLIFYKHIKEIKKNKILVFSIYIINLFVFLFFLSSTYIGKLHMTKEILKETGSIPFSVFFSEQSFFVILSSVSLFLLVSSTYISFKNKEDSGSYLILVLSWFLFAFYAVNAAAFSYKLSSFRAWAVLAIPISLLGGEFIDYFFNFIKSLIKSVVKSKMIRLFASLVILGFLFYGVYVTSFIPKYAVNTAQWGPGGFWTSGEEIGAYIWMKDNLPKKSNVFSYVNNGPVIGMDMYSCQWCDHVRSYMVNGFNQTARENHQWFKQNEYKYIIIDGQTFRRMGSNKTNNKIQDMVSTGLFNPVFQNQGAIIFSI